MIKNDRKQKAKSAFTNLHLKSWILSPHVNIIRHLNRLREGAFGMHASCAKKTGSGGRGRLALSWQATEAFSWANLEERHEKSTALRESRATNEVFLSSLRYTRCYTYCTMHRATPLTLHKQGSEKGECEYVRKFGVKVTASIRQI